MTTEGGNAVSREVRMVPVDWQHPRDERTGQYIGLFDGASYERHVAYAAEYDDPEEKPDPDWFMPRWKDGERTHFQMYETVSEGTPISPPQPTKEHLARWLAENDANAGAGATATYEEWLACIEEGSSLASFVVVDGEIVNGVAAVSRT